jgi:hypothetical protein
MEGLRKISRVLRISCLRAEIWTRAPSRIRSRSVKHSITTFGAARYRPTFQRSLLRVSPLCLYMHNPVLSTGNVISRMVVWVYCFKKVEHNLPHSTAATLLDCRCNHCNCVSVNLGLKSFGCVVGRYFSELLGFHLNTLFVPDITVCGHLYGRTEDLWCSLYWQSWSSFISCAQREAAWIAAAANLSPPRFVMHGLLPLPSVSAWYFNT